MSAASRAALDHLRRVFQAGVQAVQPASLFASGQCVRSRRDAGNNEVLEVCGEEVPVFGKRFHLVGFGKAVLGMAVQLEGVLGERLESGILSVPTGTVQKFAGTENMQLKPGSVLKMYEGASDNLPDENALEAAGKIKQLAESMDGNDILFVLISGGGSALLPAPISGVTLNEKLKIIRGLVAKGATIGELNVVRISLSQLKGGKLGECAKGAFKVISLLISDIVNDPLDLIASGPTISLKNKSHSAVDILRKYEVWNGLPEKIKFCIENEMQTAINLENSSVKVVGSNKIAVHACCQEAQNLGYQPFVLSTTIEGDVVKITEQYITFLKSLDHFLEGKISKDTLLESCNFVEHLQRKRLIQVLNNRKPNQPICFVLGGETTVEIKGNGVGGRNQELALRMALEIYETSALRNVYFLSAGTDGIDGPTPSAGAIGCHGVIEDFLEKGTISDMRKFLDRNDSYNFYKSLKNGSYHVTTGHTGTNVMDLDLIVVFPSKTKLMHKL